jgi:hypothetical protein
VKNNLKKLRKNYKIAKDKLMEAEYDFQLADRTLAKAQKALPKSPSRCDVCGGEVVGTVKGHSFCKEHL